MLRPVPLASVRPAGELGRRAGLNLRRLHGPEFQFDAMLASFTAPDAPGDWVGRALLALTEHAQLLGREAPQLAEIVARLPGRLNARGYLGDVRPAGTVDENQLGGHNALLRGLCEYHRWRPDERALAMIRSIVGNLMVPSAPLWADYPEEPDPALRDNQVVGLTVRRATGTWRGLSTDVGVGFFILDGLTQAHAVDPSPALRDLIETVIARYVRFDPVRHGAQTHSTLSTLRGILRWWREAAPRPELLALVRARFAAYRALAVTEHHANYNWFGRPEWTEPCAVVDAFLLSVQLWAATGDAELLEEAHRIFFNALAHAQRPNGGYGCDRCTGAAGLRVVAPHECFEAPWCCTMRGAEGLARAAQFGWFTGDDEIVMPFFFAAAATLGLGDGRVELAASSGYPVTGEFRLEVKASTRTAPVTLRWFAPSWSPAAGFSVRRNGQTLAVGEEAGFARVRTPLAAGDRIDVSFPLGLAAVTLQNPSRLPGARRFAHGPLLLGSADEAPGAPDPVAVGPARYRCAATGRTLAPLPALIDLSEDEAKRSRTTILFD
jgi:uncharacterized protein